LVTAATAQLESLARSRQQAAAKYKADQAEFQKHLRAAKSAGDHYRAAVHKGGAAPNELANARNEYAASVRVGDELAREYGVIQSLDSQLATAASNVSMATTMARDAANDAEEAKKLILSLASKSQKDKSASSPTSELRALGEEAKQHAEQAKQAYAETSKDAKACAKWSASGATPTFKDNQKLLSDLASIKQSASEFSNSNSSTSAIGVAARPGERVDKNKISGLTDVPPLEANARYGADPEATMQAHPEILAAMKAFDRDAEELAMPNENRAVRLADGRELLLMSGRTCRGCGAVPYWIAWDAKRRVVAFERGDEGTLFGKPDAATRSVLDQFAKISAP